jgi:hypothetical protein
MIGTGLCGDAEPCFVEEALVTHAFIKEKE